MDFPSSLIIAAYAKVSEVNGSKVYDTDNKYFRLGRVFSEILSSALRFEYTLVSPEDGEFGRQHDGKWTGMVGMVYRGEADLAISEIAIAEHRRKVIMYSYPTAVTDVTFVTQRPEKVVALYSLVDPLSPKVWLTFLVCNVLISFTLHALLRKKYSFPSVVLKVFGTFLGQQMFAKARGIPLKVVVLSWVVGMMVLSNIYKANQLSTMTFPTMKGVRNIRELAAEVEKGTYECVTFRGSYYPRLQQSTRRSFRVIGKNLEKNPGSSEPEVVLKSYRKSAFVGPKPDFMHLVNKYYVGSDSFFLEMPGIVMRKDFCCKDEVDKVVMKMYEAGLYQKALKDESFGRILGDFAELTFIPEETIDPLTLSDLQSVILFSGVGYSLSIVVFVVEVIIGAKSARDKRRTQIRAMKRKRRKSARKNYYYSKRPK